MNVVILGATRGMGRQLARQLATRGDRVFLLGRDRESLERSAADLAVCAAQPPTTEPDIACCDLDQPESFGPALEQAATSLGQIDVVVVTAARFGTQEALESDEPALEALLSANFTNTILFCEQARRVLLAQGGGTLCVFSSVAGDRARKPTILYGATKAGLSYYLEGLDHKYRHAGLRVVTVKPGFVKTGMTAGLKPPPFAGEPEAVAAQVVRAIDHGTPVTYAPHVWRPIMSVITRLPRLVMRRIGF